MANCRVRLPRVNDFPIVRNHLPLDLDDDVDEDVRRLPGSPSGETGRPSGVHISAMSSPLNKSALHHRQIGTASTAEFSCIADLVANCRVRLRRVNDFPIVRNHLPLDLGEDVDVWRLPGSPSGETGRPSGRASIFLQCLCRWCNAELFSGAVPSRAWEGAAPSPQEIA